ncbi:MAG: thioredoxin family protein, partial [Dehalococcoidia bacterium]
RMSIRQVEVFTAGCPICQEVVQLVENLSCPSCEVSVYDLRKEGMDRAREYGINRIPAVVVDGKVASCCPQGKPDVSELKAAGIGQPA